jgi:hypothetical protein
MKNSNWFDLLTADASMTDAEYAVLLERITPEPTTEPIGHPRYKDEKNISDMTPAELLQLGRELGTLGHKWLGR